MDKYRCPSPPSDLAAKLGKVTLKEEEPEPPFPFEYIFYQYYSEELYNVKATPFAITSSSEDEDDETESLNSESVASGSNNQEENLEKVRGKHDLEVTDKHPDESVRKKSRLIRSIDKEHIFKLVEDAKKHSVCGSDHQNDDSGSYEDEEKKKENAPSTSKTKQKKHHRYRSGDSDSDSSSRTKQKKHRKYRSNDSNSDSSSKTKQKKHHRYRSDDSSSDSSSKTKQKKHHSYGSYDSDLDSRSKTKQKKHFRYRSNDSDSDDDIKMKYPRERSPCSSKTRYKYYPDDASVYGESSRSQSGARSAYGDDEFAHRVSYFCEACQLKLNSEVTYQTHMEGKRHKKREKRLEELALISIADKMPNKLLQASGQAQRFPVNTVSDIQKLIDSLTYPCPGVSFIIEIRKRNSPPLYYCDLCEAQLSVQTVLPHLQGYKHLLACLERYEPATYRRFKDRKRSQVQEDLRRALERIEDIHGRGIIKVEEELQEIEPSYEDIIDEAGIDPARPDFYCELCDAHMNNRSMWKAHITGKRHVKNMKKQSMSPAPMTIDQPKISNKPAKLMSALESIDEPVVGLDHIQETQILGIGENYTCFLCGASCSSEDIIDHILLTKHRRKYLEIIRHPDFQLISSLEMPEASKDPLIVEACRKAESKHGRGKIRVVIKSS